MTNSNGAAKSSVGITEQPAAATATATQQPVPAPPPAPVPTPLQGGIPVTVGPVGVNVPGMGNVVPMTRAQLRAMDQRTSELSTQLNSAQGRRDKLVEELNQANSPAVIQGLQERLRFLDDRLLSLEQEISTNGQMKASLAAKLGNTSSRDDAGSGGSNSSNNGVWSSTFAYVMLGAVALSAARFLWVRARAPRSAVISKAGEARFQQLEQSIDTVAVEIERVSEGQRFITKMLREGQPVPDFRAAQERVPAPLAEPRG